MDTPVSCSPTVAAVQPVKPDLIPRGHRHKIKCRCPRCNEPEKLRRVGKRVQIVVSNLCHALGGLCGRCVGKDVGL